MTLVPSPSNKCTFTDMGCVPNQWLNGAVNDEAETDTQIHSLKKKSINEIN